MAGGPFPRDDDLCAVVLAGGTGRRLDPLTRAVNKHLLPIGDRPMVHYSLEFVAMAGVADVVLVTGEEYVPFFERLIRDGGEYGFASVVCEGQAEPGGIAQGLGLARDLAGGRPVVVVLADNIFEYSVASTVRRFRERPDGARLVLYETQDGAELDQTGVAMLDSDGRISAIVEKPETPVGSHVVTGVYCYEPDVFDVVSRLDPSPITGELEITDVNNYYVRRRLAEYDLAEGSWADAGQSLSAYLRVFDFVRTRGANRPGSAERTLAARLNPTQHDSQPPD